MWTDDRDEKLRATEGRYAAISALASEWGCPIRSAMARYHKARAAQPLRRSEAPAETSLRAAAGSAPRKKRATKEEIAKRRDEVSKLREKGFPVPKIAARFGVSTVTIYNDINVLDGRA